MMRETKDKDLLLITSNVGSLFGNKDEIRTAWLNRLTAQIKAHPASLIAIHLQESGGKNYKLHGHEVPSLVNTLHRHLSQQQLGYHFCRAYLDVEWELTEEYTALSAIVFVHDSALSAVAQWNFHKCAFTPLAELPNPRGILVVGKGAQPSGGGGATCEWAKKEKFVREFWPTFRWGRKGFLHTRWSLRGRVIDLVNVHLFHDESNLAFLDNPVEYSDNRRRALLYVLRQLSADELRTNSPAVFIFGDFNFRLDFRSFIKKLTRQSTESIVEDEEGGARKSLEGESSSESEPYNSVEKLEQQQHNKDDTLEDGGCVFKQQQQNVTTPTSTTAAHKNNTQAVLTKLPDGVVATAASETTAHQPATAAAAAAAAAAVLSPAAIDSARRGSLLQAYQRRRSSVVEYRRGDHSVLRIGKKRFEFTDPHWNLIDGWRVYREDDRELGNYRELYELPIEFPPTYPWSEDVAKPHALMTTRGPAWCDRVLMNEAAWDAVERDTAVYQSFGMDTCTGDHKPVLLALSLRQPQQQRQEGSGGGGKTEKHPSNSIRKSTK